VRPTAALLRRLRRGLRRPSLGALIIFLVIVFAAARGPLRTTLWPGGPDAAPVREPRAEDRIVQIVDGDTVIGAVHGTIRVLSIDTPESGRPLFDEATAALAHLVGGKQVELLFDVETVDRYGRALAHVLVADGDARLLAGEELVRRGLASVFIIPPNMLFAERLKAAQKEAVLNDRGLWALPPPAPEPYYIVGAYKFHRPSCVHAAQIPNPRRQKDRKAILAEGKSPCRNCAP
jgi:micrococcal nuclease